MQTLIERLDFGVTAHVIPSITQGLVALLKLCDLSVKPVYRASKTLDGRHDTALILSVNHRFRAFSTVSALPPTHVR